MLNIQENEITFSDPSMDHPNSSWQKIIYKNNIIGALHTSYKSVLSPLVECYMMCVLDDFQYLKNYHTSKSEDNGYVFVYFDTFDEYLEFYKTWGYYNQVWTSAHVKKIQVWIKRAEKEIKTQQQRIKYATDGNTIYSANMAINWELDTIAEMNKLLK